MLLELRIGNLVVVERAALQLHPGLNALTGSTGAGKSLILGAVNLLLGQKASTDLIRAGQQSAHVEAVFSVSGGDAAFAGSGGKESRGASATIANPSTVTVRREVRRNGRSQAYIDGRAVTARELGEFCGRWIEPHGQNEQFRLKNPEAHVEYVDAFAQNAAQRTAYTEALACWRDAQEALRLFEERLRVLREKRELLEHRVEELERARIVRGEKDALEGELRLLANAERVHAAIEMACAALYDDDDAISSRLSQVLQRLGGVTGVDDRIDAVASELETASVTISEGVEALRHVIDRLEFDPGDLERKQERLDALYTLEQRYGEGADTLVDRMAQWAKELEGLVFASEERTRLQRDLDEASQRLGERAGELSRSRHAAARELDRRMTRALEDLMMKGARFHTEVVPDRDEKSIVRMGEAGVRVSESGADVVRLRVRTNPGEPEGAVDEIASTGEISRIALGLKELISAGRARGVLIFDEIDAGVGADLGAVIAEKLLALAQHHQIVCITHMPQIAARADAHLVVVKESAAHRSSVVVQPVSGEERRREVARMLGGAEGSDKRMALAAEMLGQSGRKATSTRVRP